VEIARRAGVERSVLYRHFGSKSELFRQALTQPFLRFIESWTPPPVDSLLSGLPDALLMRHFVAGLHQQLHEHRHALRFLLFRGDELDPELRAQVVRAIRDGLASIQEGVQANMAARRFPTAHADIAVRAVVSMVVGLVTLPPEVFSSAPDDEAIVLSYVSALVVHGLALAPAGEVARSSP